MPSLEEQIVRLKASITIQGALRDTLSDTVVDTTIAALHTQLDALRAQQLTAAPHPIWLPRSTARTAAGLPPPGPGRQDIRHGPH
jgi:hypothetical protein